jgi:hypothetical protein
MRKGLRRTGSFSSGFADVRRCKKQEASKFQHVARAAGSYMCESSSSSSFRFQRVEAACITVVAKPSGNRLT